MRNCSCTSCVNFSVCTSSCSKVIRRAGLPAAMTFSHSRELSGIVPARAQGNRDAAALCFGILQLEGPGQAFTEFFHPDPRAFMRILLVSDIHSNWAALQALSEPHDLCVCLGDIVDYGPE